MILYEDSRTVVPSLRFESIGVTFVCFLLCSLHEEVLAQRALDRRLTEELARFKTSVTLLTK